MRISRSRRSRRAVLDALGGRAGQAWMAECDGRAIYSIAYEPLAPGARDDRLGPSFEAIFVDGAFVRFVQRPPDGPWPEFTGDCVPLRWAVEAPPVSADVLREEALSATAPPRHVDWGLTIAGAPFFLLLKLRAADDERPKDYRRNDELRRQFDAARLELGMSSADVAAALRSGPAAQGTVRRGRYELYGSRESFSVEPELHFTNVLVVYDERGEACVVHSVGSLDECVGYLADESAERRDTRR